MMNLHKRIIFVITVTQCVIQTQVTKQPNCTECKHVDATIKRSYINNYFHVSYRRRLSGTLAKQWPGIGDACQQVKIATLLNSLFFVIKMSFLPNWPTMLNIMIIL